MPTLPTSEREPRSRWQGFTRKWSWRQSWGIEWVKLMFCFLCFLCDACKHVILHKCDSVSCSKTVRQHSWLITGKNVREMLWLVTTFARIGLKHCSQSAQPMLPSSWKCLVLRTSRWPHSLHSTLWHAVTTCVLAANGALTCPSKNNWFCDGWHMWSL